MLPGKALRKACKEGAFTALGNQLMTGSKEGIVGRIEKSPVNYNSSIDLVNVDLEDIISTGGRFCPENNGHENSQRGQILVRGFLGGMMSR